LTHREGKIGDEDTRMMAEMMDTLRAVTSGSITDEMVKPLVEYPPALYAERLWGNL
jgi:hypothetical protein